MLSVFKYSKQEDDLYKAAFHKSLIGQALVDMKGRIVDCNEALARFLGYELEELRPGKITFMDVTYRDDVERDALQFAKLLSGKVERYSMEKRYVKKDGTTVWGRLNVISVGKSSAIEIVVGQVENIQDLKDTIAELEKSNETLKQVLRAVGNRQKESLIESVSNA